MFPIPELADRKEEQEVKDIVKYKDVGGERRFLVKQAGWPVKYNTWEPKKYLANVKKVLALYEKKAR